MLKKVHIPDIPVRTPKWGRLCSFVLSVLDFGEFKCFDGRIYRNLRELSCLFYMLTNTTLNRHGFQDV